MAGKPASDRVPGARVQPDGSHRDIGFGAGR